MERHGVLCWLLGDERWHRHREGRCGHALGWVLARWCEVRESMAEAGARVSCGSRSAATLWVGTHHVEGLRWVMAEVHRLILEEGWLHGLEHELILVHRVAHILSLAVVEDARCVVAGVLVRCLLASLWWDDLDVAMVWQKLHIWRAVKEDLSRDGWQRVSQVSQLVHTVGEAAVLSKLADSSHLEVAANLSLVVRVHCADVVSTWVVRWHWLIINRNKKVSTK